MRIESKHQKASQWRVADDLDIKVVQRNEPRPKAAHGKDDRELFAFLMLGSIFILGAIAYQLFQVGTETYNAHQDRIADQRESEAQAELARLRQCIGGQ